MLWLFAVQDYFDPSWVTIERILDVSEEAVNEDEEDIIEKYGIILDPKHPNFEEGTGRQFYVKWVNKPYSENSYEFERDLILNDVEYLEHLASYELRKQKPTREDMKAREEIGKAEMKRLYKIFSEKVKITADERESLIKQYRTKLEEKVFKNGGQLRDYQAEGVAWLMSNHINSRSSILADEMGLGWANPLYLNVLSVPAIVYWCISIMFSSINQQNYTDGQLREYCRNSAGNTRSFPSHCTSVDTAPLVQGIYWLDRS